MLRIAICDDNPLHLDHTASVAGRELCSYLPDIDLFPDAASLLRRLDEAAYAPDIAVLDIEMDGLTGIETGKRLRKLQRDVIVIFVTSHINYVSDAFRQDAFQFLLKPVKEEDFRKDFLFFYRCKKLPSRYSRQQLQGPSSRLWRKMCSVI